MNDLISRKTLELTRAIDGLTEWQKHVQTDSNINRDITIAIEALKAQLGTNLAEVSTDTISRQAAIDALRMDIYIIPYAKAREYARAVIETVYNRLEHLPAAQPEIIRCKDCKHRDAEKGFCEGRGWPMQLVPDDGFCDKGERSE